MLWIIFLAVIWVVCLAFTMLFVYRAGSVNEALQKDSEALFARLCNQSESPWLDISEKAAKALMEERANGKAL